MKQKTAKRLLDALLAAEEINAFVAGETEHSYLQDRKLQLALLHLLTILGESLSQARRDEPSVGQLLPEARQIIGMRNRIVHVYDGVDLRLLWQAMTLRVPELVPRLEEVLGAVEIDEDEEAT